MPEEERHAVFDFRFLHDAPATLLGYFVKLWYKHYMNLIVDSLTRWYKRGWIKDFVEPTELGKSVALDFEALDMEKISYINGIYFYILSCHKGANFGLMHRYEGKQVLYLRGFDYESAVSAGGGQAVGFSSIDTMRFNGMLGEQLGAHFQIFKALSPKDVYWETAAAQDHFYGDFADMIPLACHPIRSVYLNALHWKEDITHLLDRMDHYIVYVSSITESVLWELEQLDTDDRRGRVTVVFDEAAIDNKDMQLSIQNRMRDKFGDKLVWSKDGPPPAQTAAELREQLSGKFLVTTFAAFEKDIAHHRQRIAEGSARLGPGVRETHLEFRFHPALDANRLTELCDFSAAVWERITARTATSGIDCLPLFLNDIQLRIFMTLLMGDHYETGRALAAYAAVMQGVLDYDAQPSEKAGDLPEGVCKGLKGHHDMAHHIAMRMLAYGKSDEFENFTHIAMTEYTAVFARTKAAVARFFSNLAIRNASQTVSGNAH